jgi:hypothetical protein
VTGARVIRQLAFAVFFLAAMDPFVPAWLASAEARRYESEIAARFENSDLFGLGPLVTYLREHPQGRRPRIAFLGNSLVWGYGVPIEDSIPAQFQTHAPGAQILNLATNGTGTGDMYLISKAIIDSVSTLYVFDVDYLPVTRPILPQLIPVAPEDLARLGLLAPAQRSGNELLSFWRLFRDSYRLQAAFLGTSVRVSLYRGLADAMRAFGHRPNQQSAVKAADLPAIMFDSPVAATRRSADQVTSLSSHIRLLQDFARMVRDHRRSAVFVEILGNRKTLKADERAALNAEFGPEVRFVLVRIPESLKFDGVHLIPAGARALADTLWQLRPDGPGR